MPHRIEVGGVSFRVLTKPPKHWNGRHDHALYLSGSGLIFAFSSRPYPTSDLHLRVQTLGQNFLRRAPEETYNLALALIDNIGGEIRDEMITCLDLRADLPGVSVQRFEKLVVARCFSSRVRSGSIDRHVPLEGALSLRIGKGRKGRTQLQIYDKADQLRSDPSTSTAVQKLCWGGQSPLTAARVEFSIGPKTLKGLHIRTFHDYQQHRLHLVDYLTTSWFRLLERPRTNGHTPPTDPIWKDIQRRMRRWARGEIDEVPKVELPELDRKARFEQAEKTARGCLAWAIVEDGRAPTDWEALQEYALDIVRGWLGPDFAELVEAKRAEKGLDGVGGGRPDGGE